MPLLIQCAEEVIAERAIGRWPVVFLDRRVRFGARGVVEMPFRPGDYLTRGQVRGFGVSSGWVGRVVFEEFCAATLDALVRGVGGKAERDDEAIISQVLVSSASRYIGSYNEFYSLNSNLLFREG